MIKRNGVLSDILEPVSKDLKYCDDQNLSCIFCRSEFATGGLLTRHISDHTGEKLLTCVVCRKTFSLESELVIHVCGGEFSQHYQSQTEEPIPASKQFSCSQCEEGFSRSEDLNLHLKLHMRENLFSCSVCKTCCSDKDSLIQHMRIHTRQTQFICHVCKKDFTWRRHLTKHMEVHKKRKKVFRCRACGAEFCTYYLLSKHKVVHQSSESPHIQTEESREEQEQMETAADGEDFGRPEPTENLNTDTQQETNMEFCKQTREPESDLTSVRHDEVSQSDTKTNFQPFTLKEDLSQHTVFDPEIQKEVKQEDPEPPQIKEEEEEAEVTKFTFSPVPLKSEEDEKPQLLQLHHSQTEENKEFLREPDENKETSALSDPEIDDSDFWKPKSKLESGSNSESDSGRNLSSCSDNKVTESLQPESDDSVDSDFFKDYKKPQSNLNSLRQETAEKGAKYISDLKPYSCAQCSKAFRFNVYLKSHMKQHTNRYICSVCGHRSHNNSNLKAHLRTHTGEKPFSCSVCSKKFTNKASMLSHMTVHEVERKYSCDECKKTFAWFTELKYHQCVDVWQLLVSKPKFPPEQQNWSSKEDQKPLQMKEKHKEADITISSQSSEFNLNQTQKNRDFVEQQPDPDQYLEPHPENKSLISPENRGSDLLNHNRINTGEKPFSCSVCRTTFKLRTSLVLHTRTHSGVKPFCCTVCKAAFLTKYTLLQHMRIHTEQDVFSLNQKFACVSEDKSHQHISSDRE